ncbi:DUF5794 domain-containing protein [Haloplanus sp. GCM10025708]|uniref:DUF5794 domain-containing protein n=1 Tax=Haloferacaceae TaxID=1644056 RepID=UPI00361BE6DE
MSVSRHPIALRLEQQVGGATRLLATVMVLPLVDGIFPALVIAGALTYPFGIIETGLLIFGGSATVAVILAEMDGSPREQAKAILVLGAVLLPAAAVEAALAPTIQSALDMAIFPRFAGLVILTVAAKTASSRVGEYLPRPAVIIGLGLIASVQPGSAELALTTDAALVARATAAAGVGVGFALLVALLGPRLRGAVDLDRFRFGSSVALGMLALSVLGVMPTDAPVALGVLCVTAVFSFDPDAAGDAVADRSAAESEAAVADGGDADDDAGSSHAYLGEEESRAPWL